MYAQAVTELPNGDLWTYEAKLDGYRCLAAKHSNELALWSRRGNGFTTRFRDIARACEKLPPDTLIDGEVVASTRTEKSPSTHYNTVAPGRTFSFTLSIYWFTGAVTLFVCRWRLGVSF